MTNKYKARIFPNGRIAFYKRKDLEDAIKADKKLLIVCNCHTGGSTLAMGARKMPDRNNPDETITFLYNSSISRQVFTGEEMNRFYKVIFTPGERIFDNNSDYATRYDYGHHCFYNGSKKMKVNEEMTARYLSKEQVKAMIEIGVFTEKALNYCIEAISNKNAIEDSVNECSS